MQTLPTPKPQFLIGAVSSGSGKTTLTLGLLRALYKRGLRVQPFKCGPDYLDTKHHLAAAGRPSYNLDAFLASPEHLREVYARRSETADVCIIEGVMGLLDGYNRMQGSSAEIAGILDIPVILVLHAGSTAYTVAAILYGFKHFCPGLRIAGALFNFVGSASHYDHLRQACQDAGVKALGYLPKCKDIEIPSRYLGLNIDREYCFDEFADRIAVQVERSVLIDQLLEICQSPAPPPPEIKPMASPVSSLRISIARDEAFNFYYPENIRILESKGNITFFSPLHDRILPPSDFVYLPGGYPELYLSPLSKNESMRASVLAYCRQNGHLLAECGGMMYLGESIFDTDGTPYPMCGFLPQRATMENRKLRLGYRKVLYQDRIYSGHEFHYSRILSGDSPLPSVAKVLTARNTETDTPVYRVGNVTASYIHFYWAHDGQLPLIEL